MAPKRSQRQSRSSSPASWSDGSDAGPGDGTGATAQTSVANLASLQPKPCHTCARQITPRAKWARNWSSIRFCSDRCKSWKSIVRVGQDTHTLIRQSLCPSVLRQCLEEHGSHLVLHLDAWIEGLMLSRSQSATDVHHSSNEQRGSFRSLESIAGDLHLELEAEQDQPFYQFIKNDLLQRPPGEREMIRRAARRLVILPPDSWPYTAIFGRIEARVALYQNGGRTKLESLQDVSFAKGEILVQRVV